MSRRVAGLALLWLAGAASPAAAAPAPVAEPPPISLRLQETTDLWRDPSGGKSEGNADLLKLDLQADFNGDKFGFHGLTARLRAIVTNNDFFSGRRVGDLQNLSNIEGDGYAHAFEAWIEQAFAGDKASVRAGFVDLNADFDSIKTAGLFLNSSHGIGPDLSMSGVAGPSIFPVTTAGVRAQWKPNDKWTFNAGLFDGLPGDPEDPAAFAAVDLSRRAGAFVIGEADLQLPSKIRVAAGAWAYTARFAEIGAPAISRQGQSGVYGFIEGPIPHAEKWSAWLRVGRADPDVDVIDGYLGAGLVLSGPFAFRPDDRVGVAIARASIGEPAQRARGLGAAETSLEATYQVRAASWISVQPDVQYVIDPGGRYRNAVALGLRLVLTGRYPPAPPASAAAAAQPEEDPTPPDSVQPAEPKPGATEEPKSQPPTTGEPKTDQPKSDPPKQGAS